MFKPNLQATVNSLQDTTASPLIRWEPGFLMLGLPMYIPEGYGTVFPYLFVSDARPYLSFLQRAFGAEVLGCLERPAGRIANARVRIGDTRFMVSEASERFPPSRSALYIYVENADGAFQRAIESGATAIMAPMDMPYGDRQGGVTDPSGNIWWVTTRFDETPYEG